MAAGLLLHELLLGYSRVGNARLEPLPTARGNYHYQL